MSKTENLYEFYYPYKIKSKLERWQHFPHSQTLPQGSGWQHTLAAHVAITHSSPRLFGKLSCIHFGVRFGLRFAPVFSVFILHTHIPSFLFCCFVLPSFPAQIEATVNVRAVHCVRSVTCVGALPTSIHRRSLLARTTDPGLLCLASRFLRPNSQRFECGKNLKTKCSFLRTTASILF